MSVGPQTVAVVELCRDRALLSRLWGPCEGSRNLKHPERCVVGIAIFIMSLCEPSLHLLCPLQASCLPESLHVFASPLSFLTGPVCFVCWWMLGRVAVALMTSLSPFSFPRGLCALFPENPPTVLCTLYFSYSAASASASSPSSAALPHIKALEDPLACRKPGCLFTV